MTSKRKADLQRKLSMVSVPKPPAGLADRIKNDIPEYLGTKRERERFTKSIAFDLRVAASVILLVASTVFCLQLFMHSSPESAMNEKRMAASSPIAELARADKKSDVLSNATPPPLRQPVIAPNAPPMTREPVANIAPPPSIAERIVLHRNVSETTVAAPPPPPPAPAESAPVWTFADNAVAGNAIAADARDEKKLEKEKDFVRTLKANEPVAETVVVTASAPAVAPAPVPLPTAMGAMTDRIVAAKTQATSMEVVRSAQAADLDLAARDSVFGISVNDGAFGRVKDAIERGERPANVDVEGLVNYFAGPASRSPREVSLEVEGSPAPVNEGERTVFVRYTVDTARDEFAHASVPPIATNAHVEIEFDPRAVASYRRVGGEPKTDLFEPSLLKNVSVTALYAVTLKSNVTNLTPLATITLHYNSVTNGRVRLQTRTLRVGDVARPWARASRRHRLASLGAVWGEKMKLSSPSGADVVRRAEELSKQEPTDERAKELATLANASSR